jgi:hypothetical protein
MCFRKPAPGSLPTSSIRTGCPHERGGHMAWLTRFSWITSTIFGVFKASMRRG